MGNISHLKKEMVRLLWQRLPDHVFTECLLDGEVTDGGRSVTGYSKLRSTNVFRRSQSSCSASASSFKFNNNSFMQNMRQSGATIVGWGLRVPYVHAPGSTNIAQLIIMYTWSDHRGNLANCLIPFIHLWIPSLSLADIYKICDISVLISSKQKMGHDKLLFSISVWSICTDKESKHPWIFVVFINNTSDAGKPSKKSTKDMVNHCPQDFFLLPSGWRYQSPRDSNCNKWTSFALNLDCTVQQHFMRLPFLWFDTFNKCTQLFYCIVFCDYCDQYCMSIVFCDFARYYKSNSTLSDNKELNTD